MATFLESEVVRLKIDIEVITNDIRAFQERLQNPDLSALQRGTAQRNLDRAQTKLVTLQAELSTAEAAAAQQKTPNPQPPEATSAGQQATDAEPNNPNKQTPEKINNAGQVVTPPPVTAPTNADVPATLNRGGGDLNTDPPVKTLAETQSTQTETSGAGLPVQSEDGTLSNLRKNPETGELYDPGGPANVTAPTNPGVGANDDNPQTNGQESSELTDKKQTQSEVSGKKTIKPQPNVLDNFASYTYSASVYAMSSDQFNAFTQSRSRAINGYYLLFQSGGAPLNSSGPLGQSRPGAAPSSKEGPGDTFAAGPSVTGSDAGRNPFFQDDFYIDKISVENVIGAGGEGGPFSVGSLKFTVIEPMNITLIDKLYQVAQDLAPRGAAGAINYSAMTYLMVIRFYGYTIDGKLVAGVKAADPKSKLSDPNSIVEKYIPFNIKELNWSVGSKQVSYDWVCSPAYTSIGAGTRRGTIPFDLEVSGGSVKEVLAGAVSYVAPQPSGAAPGAATTSPGADDGSFDRAEAKRLSRAGPESTPKAPPKANAAPAPTIKKIKQGLLGALNDIQKELVQKKIYNIPDRYVIEFATGADSIENATLLKPGTKTNKPTTPMTPAASQDTSVSSPDKQKMDTTQRNVSVKAGTQVVQALDLIIRNSSYITDQADIVIDEATNQPIPNPKSNSKSMQWFRIIMQTTQLEYDEKRNDYAYEIKFIIVPFELTEMWSPFFPLGVFRGLHKTYPWWFTGQNTAVISYEANFNKNYFLTVSGSEPGKSDAAEQKKKVFASMTDVPFIQHSARSNESSQGSDSKANELAASAAEYLYSESSPGQSKLTIVGDPAWIQQGSVAGGIEAATFDSSPFNADGTINFDCSDVLYEVVWQRPEDYDLNTGIADPYKRTQAIFGDRQPRQSVIYKANKVISDFQNGGFKQTIEGSLYVIPLPDESNKAPTAAASAGKSTVDKANVTEETARRTGVPLTTENAARARSTFAATDPRRLDLAPRVEQSSNFPATPAAEAASQTNAAEAANYGKPGPTTPNEPVQVRESSNAGISPAAPGPDDTVAPLAPPTAPTSNGQTVGTVSGRLVMGQASGPITVDGRVINPGDSGYADAAERLVTSQNKLNQRFNRSMNNSAPVSAGAQSGSRDF
jgi:hypothetical protein